MSAYSILGLILFVAWALLAGVGRMIVQRRRTGDSGFRFATAAPGTVQWWANRINAAGSVAVGVVGPVVEILGPDPGASPFGSPVLRTAALVVAAVGVACTYAAQLAMGTAWRIGVDPAERTTLVTSGPFALVRNPIFTAALITFAGLAMASPNLVSLLGLGAVYAGIQMQVRGVEEPHLLATHGVTYAAYAARVGRFLPGIGRL
ncbi:isoprenylcysteine carboxylmethyltransferase family protein [Cellulomonas sp. PhB150]|uniref:methyltransferase family protein n=1 Tax=Cellulomonas sp. PhB150 TaxID=2485188 RepID=UPI000FBB0ABC|nr:isoprenylcysteine carboxylmethyltransferase family protein [Cellulomonas sp. PhB150]ROS26265.1 protein-S-isoprenylcysteine O-methyltransferase Ste14 [Cellulomonas sp. PhB150]